MTTPSVIMLTNALAPDKLGGLERYVRELSAALVRKDVPVTVLTKLVNTTDPLDEVGDDGVRIVRHSVPSKKNPLFAAAYPLAIARSVVSHLRADADAVVHGHYPITTLPALAVRRPYVYTFHNPVHKEILSHREGSYFLPSFLSRGAVASLRSTERQVLRRARSTVVLSQFTRNEVSLMDEKVGARTEVLAGGIDTNFFTPGGADRDAWSGDAWPLLFTARRLTERTGVTELVRAMPEILLRYPEARLAIAGDGTRRREVEGEVERLGLSHRVRLLGRINDDNELRRWYRSSDLTIMPTQSLEGFGLTTGESLACGTPVMVTPVSASPELVENIDPFLVATGITPPDMAQSVCKLLDSRVLERPDMADACRAQAHPAWSWNAIADRYVQLYSELQSSARS